MPRRLVVLLVGAAAVAWAPLTACGRDGFADRRATVTIDGETTDYELDSCGLDGSTVFIVGRAPDRFVLQAVVELDEDAEAVAASSGLTAGPVNTPFAAFGPAAWRLRSGPGPSPGRVEEGWLRGSRILLTGWVEQLDPQDRVTPEMAPRPFRVEARCDEVDDGSGG